MSKFGKLAAEVDIPFKVFLIDPATDEEIVDKSGEKAFIEVLSQNSELGQQIDREQQRKTNARVASGRRDAMINEDNRAANQAKLSRLTKSWHLVDPESREPIDVECNQANALELYADRHMFHIFMQVFTASAEVANFIKRSSKTSSPLPSGNSASNESEMTARASAST
jgi:hypothetical protein